MATAKLTSTEVRLFLMDKPELNTLLDGVRFSEEDIEFAQKMCCAYFNESAPRIASFQFDVEGFPFTYCMLMWVSGHLLRSAAINQASNNLAYSADGISVNDSDKAQIFMTLGKDMQDEAKDMIKQIKVQKNIENAYGFKSSEFIRIVR
jgi:hypothetical protein